jgi:hypothetical protein
MPLLSTRLPPTPRACFEPERTLRGRVVDDHGQPIAGVRLRAVPQEGSDRNEDGQRMQALLLATGSSFTTADSGADGSFTLWVGWPGRYALGAPFDFGPANARDLPLVSDGETSIVVTLKARGPMRP